MKKIGIMYGMESEFPEDILNSINKRNVPGVRAEPISIDATRMDHIFDYNVIFDRVSNEVPFYRAVLKQAAMNNIHVINNPFWNCADDSFFHASLAAALKIAFPRTVILPSKDRPVGTVAETLRNMKYPLDWDNVFEYIGFPAFIKPNRTDAMVNDYKVYNEREFFSTYDLTGNHTMILQENIDYEEYFRCFVINKKLVRIMPYDPSKPYHLRYMSYHKKISGELQQEIEKLCFKICTSLGFDFNSIEFAVRNGKPIAIDFHNTSPRAERSVLTDSHYDWLVETTSDFLTTLASRGKFVSSNYNWSTFLRGPKSPVKKRKRK